MEFAGVCTNVLVWGIGLGQGLDQLRGKRIPALEFMYLANQIRLIAAVGLSDPVTRESVSF